MSICEHLLSGMCELTGRKGVGNLPSKAGEPRGGPWAARNCLATNKSEQATCSRFRAMNASEWDKKQLAFIMWTKENVFPGFGEDEVDEES